MRSAVPLLAALLLAACQSSGIPETRSEPLPKGTALPPPEHDMLPNQTDDAPEE